MNTIVPVVVAQVGCTVTEPAGVDGVWVTVPVNETVCADAPVDEILNDPFTLPTEAVLVSLTNTFVADKVPLAVIVTVLV